MSEHFKVNGWKKRPSVTYNACCKPANNPLFLHQYFITEKQMKQLLCTDERHITNKRLKFHFYEGSGNIFLKKQLKAGVQNF